MQDPTNALRKANRENVCYRILLVVLSLIILATFWQLDLALQTLRMVATPPGSTAFLVRSQRLSVRDIPVDSQFVDSLRVGERIAVVRSGGTSAAAVPVTQQQNNANNNNPATAAVRICEANTNFVFSNNHQAELALWCVGVQRNTMALHAINLHRLNATILLAGVAASSSTSSTLQSQITSTSSSSSMFVGSASTSTIMAEPFIPNSPPSPGAITVVDVVEIFTSDNINQNQQQQQQSSIAAAVVLLRETTHGSIFSTTCSAASSSSSSSSSTTFSCTEGQLLSNGNQTNFTSCVMQLLRTSSTSNLVQLAASCNTGNSSAIFIATVSRTAKQMTQFWQQVQLPTQQEPLYISKVVSVPRSFPTSQGDDGMFAHIALSVSFSSSYSSSPSSSFTASILDLSAAVENPTTSPAAVMTASSVALPDSLCAYAFNETSDTDVDSAFDQRLSVFGNNCTCCDGWVVDETVRSIVAGGVVVDPLLVHKNGNGTTAANANSNTSSSTTTTTKFISFLHGNEELGTLIHLNVTFKNLHLTSAASSSSTASSGRSANTHINILEPASSSLAHNGFFNLKQLHAGFVLAHSTRIGATAVLALSNGTSNVADPIGISPPLPHLRCPVAGVSADGAAVGVLSRNSTVAAVALACWLEDSSASNSVNSKKRDAAALVITVSDGVAKHIAQKDRMHVVSVDKEAGTAEVTMLRDGN